MFVLTSVDCKNFEQKPRWFFAGHFVMLSYSSVPLNTAVILYNVQLVASLDGVEQSLSVTREQMSATVTASELTSYDVSELRQQLDSHDALMHRLASLDSQLQATKSQAQALDTDIAGEFTNT